MATFLDKAGLTYFYSKIKNALDSIVSEVTRLDHVTQGWLLQILQEQNAVSGNIDAMAEKTICGVYWLNCLLRAVRGIKQRVTWYSFQTIDFKYKGAI